jgi:iron-sulfur cluster repair protein YtfE (RIC family)
MHSIHAIRILSEDHKKLKGLFRQLEALTARAREADAGSMKMPPGGMERSVAEELFAEIEIHLALEEQIFYPALISALRERRAAGGSPVDLDAAEVDSGLRDHREVRELVRLLRHLPMETLEFSRVLDELSESVETHMAAEERTLLPEAEVLLERDIEDLGAQMRNLRIDLLKQQRAADEKTTAA